MAEDHFTKESEGKVGSISTVEDARRAHHLASADPEPERGDGTLTGAAHEEKYGLERAEGTADAWRSAGVHPVENRALVGDEEGAENLRGYSPAENAAKASAPEQATKK